MTPSTPAARMVARSAEDLVAMVPVVLGFVPEDSVVLLMFEAARTFHARLDLPSPGEVDDAVQAMLEPALRHGARRVVLLLYADRSRHTHRVGRSFVSAFQEAGVEVVQALRADGRRCYPLLPGSAAVPAEGRPYDLAGHRFTAQAVLDGHVTHRSREELAATLRRDPARVAAVAARLATAVPPDVPDAAGWVAQLVRRHAGAGTVPDDEEAARLLVAVRAEEVRDAALRLLHRRDAADHVALWTDLVRRCPDDLLPTPSALLGFAAWVSGHGALAWCAVDVCLAIDPDHRLAGLLTALLAGAVPPSEWDAVRLAAG